FRIFTNAIVLHGSLAVPPWPEPHVEFDLDPWRSHTQPEYRALRSWIPGGTIQQYQWNFTGSAYPADPNRFVTADAPIVPMVGGRVCLTFTGSRISASGPIAYETVVATMRCKWRNSPIGRKPAEPDLSGGDRPHVIVPFPGPPHERLEAAAHVSPWAP